MQPEIRTRAVLLVDEKSRPPVRVTACSRLARRQGVRAGMAVAEARSILRGPVEVREHDPAGDREALERLACFCERYTPVVSLEEGPAPSSLLLEMTGCLPYFKGPQALLALVAGELEELGLVARLALAESVGLAWGVAHYGRWKAPSPQRSARLLASPGREGECQARSVLPEGNDAGRARGEASSGLGPLALAELGGLPVEALRLSPQTLHLLEELGLQRVSDLQRLDRAELGSRLGSEVLLRLDQALGTREEVLVPHRPPLVVEGAWSLEHPTANQETLEGIFLRVIERLFPLVESRGEGIQRLHFVLSLAEGPPQEGDLELMRGAIERDHFAELWRLQLERQTLPAPVTALCLKVTGTRRLEVHQGELFEESKSVNDAASWEQVIDRLSSRLGADQVTRVRFRHEAEPERACRYEPWVRAAHRLTVRRNLAAPSGRRSARAGPEEDWEERLGDPSGGSNRGWHRPIRLRAEPLRIDVVAMVPDGPPVRFQGEGREHRVCGTWGPERIETGWWRGSFLQRDYYQVETDDGSRYWLFRRRQDGAWFLHGWFD